MLLGSKLRRSLLVALLSSAWVLPAGATPFADGDVTSYDQNIWGADPPNIPPASTLNAQFFSVYTAGFELGHPGGGFVMDFSGPDALLNYLPQSGTPSALIASSTDPTSSSSGLFGGQVAGLALNVDFNDAGLLPNALGVKFGDLLFHDLAGSFAALNGTNVRGFLSIVNIALGAGSTPYGIADLSNLLTETNASFQGGFVSAFANDHLAVASTTGPGGGPSVPEPTSLALVALGIFGVAGVRRSSHTD